MLNKSQSSVDNSTELPIKTTEIDALLIEQPGKTIQNLPKKDSTTTSETDPITGNNTKSETTNNIKTDSGTFTEAKNGTVSDITNSITTPAETKPNSSETETKIVTVSENSTNTKNLSETKTDSPPVETKNATLSEIPDSNETTADTTSEKCKCTETVETQNTTVSEIPTSATKPVEVKADSSATETKNPKVSEIPNPATKPAETKPDSPTTETKNSTKPAETKADSPATETKNSTKPAETKPDSSATETKNPTVSEIPNPATKPAETKPDSSATETKNPTVSEIPTSTTKPAEVKADSSATDTKNSTVSEIPTSTTKPVEVKADSSATDTKNPTVSEIPNSDPKPAETKADSPTTETKNPTVSEIPNSATKPAETKVDSSVTDTKNTTVATNPAEVKPDSPATETKNVTVAINPIDKKPDSPATETKNSTVATNPVEVKPDSPATETKNSTVATKPVEKQPDFSVTETKNVTVSQKPVSENTQSAVTVINSIDEITGNKIEKPVIFQPDTLEIPTISAESTDILTGETQNTSPILIDTAETASSQNNQPSASEYIVTDTQTIIPEIAVISNPETAVPSPLYYSGATETDITQNHDSQQSENIIANSDNQPPTTIDKYVNPDFDSPKIAITPEIPSDENNQLNNSQNIIADSEIATKNDSNSQAKINEYTIANTETQPLIGIIDTGFTTDNPNIDYSQIILGKDVIDNDNNPLLQPNEGNQHGSTILEIIASDKNNHQTPIWLGRATGSGNWHESLIEFVDAAKALKQPNAVVNLSFDLTEISPDGRETTRYKLTEPEKLALKYAQENNILIVAAAGNQGSKSSALGQASTEFPNIITVGAASNNNRSGYSSYGEGLDILALDTIGSTTETTTQPKSGTSIAAAKVTATISQMWAANPKLNTQQIKNILLQTATDIDVPGWDERTGYGILNPESAIATATETIPTIAVLAATKQLTKPLVDIDINTSNPANNIPAKPSSRAALTNAKANTPKTTSTSTGDNNQGTSSSTTELAPNTTSNTSKSGGTTSTNTQTNSHFSHTNSNWDKSRSNTNSKGNSLYETTTDTNTNTRDYTDKNNSFYSIERTDKSQSSSNRLKYEGTGNSQTSAKQKWSANRNYTSPSHTQKSASESYLNNKNQSDSKYDGNNGESNSKSQEESGSKSSVNNKYTSSNGTSGDNSTTQRKGKSETTSSNIGKNSSSTYKGENSEVNQSNSQSKTSSDSYKTNNSSDNRSTTNNTWDNTTTNGKTVGSSIQDTYSEGNNNNNTSYDDGKSKNKSNTDTYTQNQSQETNSSNGTNSWRNNRNNNYSVTSGNNTDTYKNGGDTRNYNRDHYSINKSNSSSSNSAGKPSSKNESENYSENQEQWDSEYKADTYTTTSNSDQSTITASKSNSSTEGNNTTSSNSSDTSRTGNSQTVTTYKDGRKTENGSSTYEKWLRDSSYDSKGVVSDVSKYSSWTSSYSKNYFKGGYSWTESLSGSDSESTTKRAVYTSSSSSWSWTRNGTVWDDGRNSWSESWSKSSWKDGKYLPSESESKNGSFDPKKTGQINDLPSFEDVARLSKAPKKRDAPLDLSQINKLPKPSKELWTLPPRITPPRELEKAPDNLVAGPGGGGSSPDIGKLPYQDKLLSAIKGSVKYLKKDAKELINLLSDPKFLAAITIIATAFGAANLVGIGEIIDFVLVFIIGLQAVSDLTQFFAKAWEAKSVVQLEESAKNFAKFVESVGAIGVAQAFKGIAELLKAHPEILSNVSQIPRILTGNLEAILGRILTLTSRIESQGTITGTTRIGTRIPGVVQSRINLALGRTRFTPLKDNGQPVSAGFNHVISGHFGGGNTQSQFTISQDALKTLLQRSNIVSSPLSTVGSGNQVQYIRNVNTGTIVGTVRQSQGGGTTTWIRIYTDRAGNLITTYPVPAP